MAPSLLARRLFLCLVASVLALTALAGVSASSQAAPASKSDKAAKNAVRTTVTACLLRSTGELRVVPNRRKSPCRHPERVIRWKIGDTAAKTGPQGPAGPQGPRWPSRSDRAPRGPRTDRACRRW